IIDPARTWPADVHHGLDRQDHTVAQLRSVPGSSVVRNLRVFVQLRTDAVPDELPHHAEAVGLNQLLHGCSYIADGVAHTRRFYAVEQRLPSHLEQLL